MEKEEKRKKDKKLARNIIFQQGYDIGKFYAEEKYKEILSCLRHDKQILENEKRRIQADLIWKADLLNVRRVPVQEYKNAKFLLISKMDFDSVVWKND